jgi:hypothetical protein
MEVWVMGTERELDWAKTLQKKKKQKINRDIFS